MEKFVDLSFVERHSIPLVDNKRPLQVFTVDGRAIRFGLVTQECHRLSQREIMQKCQDEKKKFCSCIFHCLCHRVRFHIEICCGGDLLDCFVEFIRGQFLIRKIKLSLVMEN